MRIDSLICRVLMLCVVVVTRVVMGIGVAVVVIMFVAGMFMFAFFVIMFAASVFVVIFFCMIMRMLFATVPIVMIVIMGVEAGTFANVELMNSRRIDQFDRYSILGHGFDRLLQRGSQFWPNPEHHIGSL